MISKKKGLNSGTNIINTDKRRTCWYCKLNGYNILDEFGCCKRCETNLNKYPVRESHPYPELDNNVLASRVLGHRKRFSIVEGDDE